ncbi:hypothetical protein [Pseudomonas sp. D3-10]|uniref:hypothetical protein n=1 Tax=Pseudomonas sp. D3-10 TaxID=2817392 RepID=UPI003DA7F1D0
MKVIDKNNFYEEVERFYRFETEIEDLSEESFRKAYESGCASKHKNIVYILRAEKKVARLKGESDILYIGQTKHSFKKRYAVYAKLHTTSLANRLKFEHILKAYGKISIAVSDFSKFGGTLHEAEGQLLWWYFQNHCEYPPINYTKTSIRNEQIFLSHNINPA